jgi:hypothetical protein
MSRDIDHESGRGPLPRRHGPYVRQTAAHGDDGMKLRLLIVVFLAASFFLALWLLANWFAWSMADFDCDDGYWACRREIAGPTALRVGLGLMAWAVPALLLLREWKKG